MLGILGGATACGEPPPIPWLECRSGEDCPSGRCVNSICQLAENDVPGGDSAHVDVTPDADKGPCDSDDACRQRLGKTGSCSEPVCTDGTCSVVPLMDATTCTDGAVCPSVGACLFGVCEASSPPCDDGNPCTADYCFDTGCSLIPFQDGTPCADDGLPCTAERCVAQTCTSTLQTDSCVVEGVCRSAGEARPGNPCEHCMPQIDPFSWAPVDTGPCDDDDACTVGEACDAAGGCEGEVVVCEDANPCTDDSCDASAGCIHLSNGATCTDDDPCTLDGGCEDGGCVPDGGVSCDDGNVCTADHCEAGIGCLHTPTEGSCLADADPCTVDLCVGGACIGVPAPSVCKINGSCVPSGSKAADNDCMICDPGKSATKWTVLSGATCADGNACTSFDTCVGSECVGQATLCDDGNPCTNDGCDPEAGCTFVVNSSTCDDLDACTVGDVCIKGVCLGSPMDPKGCDDGNSCTIDYCDLVAGCTHPPGSDPCDDGNPCTTNEVCNSGKCLPGKLVCPCAGDSDCVDGNPCTTDVCIEGVGCANSGLGPNKDCDDANACTHVDVCAGGMCAGAAILCDDTNPCTFDSCVAETGCIYLPVQGLSCDDADACTNQDLCIGGACDGTPKNCDDGSDCTIDWCDSLNAVCGHDVAPPGTACSDDGVSCTVDRCELALCSHTQVESSHCFIGGVCLSGGALHPALACMGCKPLDDSTHWTALAGKVCKDASACTAGDECSAQGVCVGEALACDDGNPCTQDACNPLGDDADPCVHGNALGECDDGDTCTEGDACVLGLCIGKLIDCDDANTCTLDSCAAQAGCQHEKAADGLPCPADGLPCTSDACDAGKCAHPVSAGVCLIDQVCRAAGDRLVPSGCLGCAPEEATQAWTALTGVVCNDGDVCTAADLCASGGCIGGVGSGCDDGNPCTDDGCEPVAGCTHFANKSPCDDANSCTANDACDAGDCLAGPPVVCPVPAPASACVVSWCDPASGCQQATACGPLHACIDGLCVTSNDDKSPAPTTVPFDQSVVFQPVQPTIRWLAAGAGTGAIADELWLAVQNRACKPNLGGWAEVLVGRLAAGTAAMATKLVSVAAPGTTPKRCAIRPQLAEIVGAPGRLAAAWVEGGAQPDTCPLDVPGGLVRVAVMGPLEGLIETKVTAPCPVAGAKTPLAQQPSVALDSPVPGLPLVGLLVRGGIGGPLRWHGGVATSWGAGSGADVAVPEVVGGTVTGLGLPPMIASWQGGKAIVVAVAVDKAGEVGPGVAVTTLAADGATGPGALVVDGLIDGSGGGVYAVRSAWHTDAQRLGVLISVAVAVDGAADARLGFAAVDPAANEATAAMPVVHLSLPSSTADALALRACALVAVPGSGDFLIAWATGDDGFVRLGRVAATAQQGTDFVNLGTIGGGYTLHATGGAGDGAAGLSDLAIDPGATRVSLAWETAGGLTLATLPLAPFMVAAP